MSLKKIASFVLVIFVLLMLSCNKSNSPSDFEYIIISDNVITFVGYTGKNPDVIEDKLIIAGYVGERLDVVIPSKIEGKQVTIIGEYAFENNSLTSVTIINSTTEIGQYAFAGCTSLTNINIPESATTINEGVFNGCSSLTSITIPDSVTTIYPGAFAHCRSLTNLTIPDNVTAIWDYAFTGCDSLSEETKQRILEINPDAIF